MDDFQTTTTGSEGWTDANDIESVDTEEVGEKLSTQIARIVRLCWKKRRLVLGIVVAGILLSLIYALTTPNTYISTTTLMPPGSATSYSNIISMLSASSSAASLGSEALGLESPLELFVSILESRNVQDGLIARFNLLHYYKSRTIEDARTALAANTTISEDRKSGIITISVRAGNPEFACNLARGYVAELNRVVTDDSTSAARRERIFLEGRLANIEQQLDDSSRALSQFSAKNKAIDMPSQVKSMVDTGLRLQAELIDGRSQLAGLRQTYSEDNYRVRAVEARNAELQRQIDAMGGTPHESSSAADTSNSGYPTVSQLPALGITYYDLERRVRVDEALWEALTKEYEAAKVEEAKEIPTVHVLDVANVPQRKSSPVRWLIMVIGAISSFVAACLLVLGLGIWKKMDPQAEPKKILTETADAIMSPRHWPWRLPGLSWVHKHLTGST